MKASEGEANASGRLARAVVQLEACADLIDVATGPSLRMAIVLLDNLVDNLLFRRLHRHIQRSYDRGLTFVPRKRVTKKELANLEQSFGNKLRFVVAMTDPHDPDSAISQSDVDVIRISHRYRNAIYHRDTHNPVVVPVIARLLFGATCRLLPTAYQPGWGTTDGTTGPAADVIKQYKGGMEDGMLWPRQAANVVAKALEQRFTLSTEETVATLVEDIRTRCDELRDLIDYLPSDGMGLKDALSWTEFWDRNGNDPQLVRLADRADTWQRRNEPDQEAVCNDADAAQLEYNKLVWAKWRTYQPDASLDEIDRARLVGDALVDIPDAVVALRSYHEVDVRLAALEEFLGQMVEGYDRKIDRQIDEWRETH